MLGPLTVEPAFEGRGIGAALMRRSLEAARQKGHELVLLVGDEAYYRRFGFKRVPARQLELPGPVQSGEVPDGGTGRGRARRCQGTGSAAAGGPTRMRAPS